MSKSDPDESLLRSLNAGTRSAADKLDRKYREKLNALAKRKMKDRLGPLEASEDIAVRVLEIVVRKSTEGKLNFDHAGALWRYLETVTGNMVVKRADYTGAKKRTQKSEEHVDADQLPTQAPTAEQEAIAKEQVDKLLDGLDTTYRQVVLLLLEDRSERDIATQLGLMRSAVTTRIKLLRERLARLLAKERRDDSAE